MKTPQKQNSIQQAQARIANYMHTGNSESQWHKDRVLQQKYEVLRMELRLAQMDNFNKDLFTEKVIQSAISGINHMKNFQIGLIIVTVLFMSIMIIAVWN